MSDELSPAAQFAAAAAAANATTVPAPEPEPAQPSTVEAVAQAPSASDLPASNGDNGPAPIAVEKVVSVWPAVPIAAAADSKAVPDTVDGSDISTGYANIANENSSAAPTTTTTAAVFAAAAAAAEEEAECGPSANDSANDECATASLSAVSAAETNDVATVIPAAISPASGFAASVAHADDGHFSAAAAFESAVDSAVASTSGDDDNDNGNEDAEAEAEAETKRSLRKKPIDLADEELFPSLGSPASSSGAKIGASWGASARNTSASANGGATSSMAQQIRLNQTTEIVDLPMMQEPVGDTVRKIMAATKTRIEVSNNAVLNTSTYLISGKPDAVARAKRDVCAKLSPRVTKIIQVPAVARSQIFGMRGRTLQTIQSQTGTAVSLGKPSDNNATVDDVFEQIDVTISGSHSGVGAAIAQIEALVDKRTTKRVIKLAELPREANAMLLGKGGETLRALQGANPGVQIRIPGPIDADQVVRVLGERDAVQAAAAEIAETARLLMQGSQTVSVSIPKRQHRFIIGDGGQTIRDIVEATGCSVVVPAPRNPSDQVTVRGPESSLVQALGLVMTKANSMVVETVDPTAIHEYPRPLIYAQRVLQYLHDRNRFRRIESEHDVTLRAPSVAQALAATSPAQVQIEVQGKDARAVGAASKALTTLLQAFPPFHFNGIDVEPHLHALLAGPDGTNVARLQTVRSVHTLFPQDKASSSIVVVYEGFNPDIDRIASIAERERATRDLLRKTLEEFRATVVADSSHVAKVIKMPIKLQEALSSASAVNSILAAADVSRGAKRVVAVRFGLKAPVPESESKRSERKKNEGLLQPDEVEVKGLAPDVDRVIAELSRRANEAADRERLYSFTAELSVPQSMMPRVVGRNRDNVKRLQSEHDITVDIADNHAASVSVLKLKGRAESVAAARDELLAFVERMADHTDEIVSVAANIHKALIGAGGRYVKRLEEKYSVRIQFPSSRSRGDKDKEKEKDRESAVSLGPDQILISGGRKGVEGAKGELLELAAYEIEHNHTVRFRVPASCLPFIVGRGGAHINEIKEESDTRIDLGEPVNEEVEVTLIGTRAGTKIAREAIEATVAEQKTQTEITIDVPVKHHRFLIGAGGGRVRELVQQAGGDPDLMNGIGSCRVQFPRVSADANDQVRLSGDSNIVDAVCKRIEELVAERERMTTVLVSIPVSQHAFIIGRGGANLKQMQDTHSVEIFFPRSANRNSNNSSGSAGSKDQPGPSDVRITGLPENCEACKAALLQLVREEATVVVPLALHQRLGGRHGSLWRQMRAEFDVQADAGRVDKAPARRVDQVSAVNNDNEEAEDSAPGRVVYRDVAADLAGLTAEWILRGEKTKLAQAVDLVTKQITDSASAVEARVNIGPRNHRFIIGKQGANIAKIRNMTGCEVDVPKKGNKSHWVTITGDRASIDHALDLINQCIEDRE